VYDVHSDVDERLGARGWCLVRGVGHDVGNACINLVTDPSEHRS
jgi:hypothetical protein